MARFPPRTERGIHAARVAVGLCFVLLAALFAPVSEGVVGSSALSVLGGAMIGIASAWWERTSDRPLAETLPWGRTILLGGIAGILGSTVADHYPIVFWYAILGFFVVGVVDSLQSLLAQQDWGRVTNLG